jgi:hypothetical protein
MKKYLTIASYAAVVLVAGCAKNMVIEESIPREPVSFGVYAGQAATKATYGDITTAALQSSADGFSVFGYYTQDNDWTIEDKPNFMYNQQVRYITDYGVPADFIAAKYPSHWYYTPLKYWPNGTNSTTVESGTIADKLSFFAYAPHIATASLNSVPATGQGITAMSANNATGAPTISFTVPAKAEEQIDLLWANPIKDVTKQQLDGRVSFTFKHALAKLNIQVQAVVDAVTPVTSNLVDDGDASFEHGETWIILQSLDITANGTKTGTLVLDGAAAVPNWTSVSGNTTVEYASASFTSTSTAGGVTGFKVTETATDLNSAISPMIIPKELASGDFVIVANYWVITADTALYSGYSAVQNIIQKTSTAAITFTAGYKYNIVVRLGLNSIDFDVTEVTDWGTGAGQTIDLPQNS